MAPQRYIDPRLGEILLNQTSRARRLSITVLVSGTVRLSYPKTLSTKRALECMEQRVEWILAAQQRLKARREKNPPAVTHDVEELRQRAKEYLPTRVEEISRIIGLKYSRLTIRPAQTKWGSCSSQGNLSLSLYLMTLPRHLIDFVIVHELCHTVHFNHSAEFHALVNSYVGGKEKLLTKELKGYSIR